jgi:hypothetical protein
MGKYYVQKAFFGGMLPPKKCRLMEREESMISSYIKEVK